MRLVGPIGLLALALLAAPGAAAAAASTWPSSGRRHMLMQQQRTTPSGFLPPVARQWPMRRPQHLVIGSSRAVARGRAATTAMSAVGGDENERRRQLERQQQEQQAAAMRPVPEFVAEANKKIVSSIKGAWEGPSRGGVGARPVHSESKPISSRLTNPVVQTNHPTDALVTVYGDRHYARFHALETIARVPYFAYTSVLHLYEVCACPRSQKNAFLACPRVRSPSTALDGRPTDRPPTTPPPPSRQTLGWRRRADLMKLHFAESWNELHHLLIMEELGGSDRWADRVIAVHLAFFYYWVAIAVYVASPETAYNLNEQVRWLFSLDCWWNGWLGTGQSTVGSSILPTPPPTPRLPRQLPN